MNNFKYTYLLKYLHVGQISLVSEINICNQIFGTITSLSQKLQKLKKNFLIDAHYKTWAVFSDITKKLKYFLFFTQGAYWLDTVKFSIHVPFKFEQGLKFV